MKQNIARQILEVVPPLMHRIRQEIRAAARTELTVPQFRILSNIRRGICYTDEIADYQGVSLPAISRAVGKLVKLGLISRIPRVEDRRRVELRLTGKGHTLLHRFQLVAENMLQKKLSPLSKAESRELTRGLVRLGTLFPLRDVRAQRREK